MSAPCGHDLPSATPVDGSAARPSAGDASICIRCGALAIFTGHGYELRAPTGAERDVIARMPSVVATVDAVLALWDER